MERGRERERGESKEKGGNAHAPRGYVEDRSVAAGA